MRSTSAKSDANGALPSSDSQPSDSQNRGRQGLRQGLRQRLRRMLVGTSVPSNPRSGALLLEALEQRQMMAGDMDLWFTNPLLSTVSSSGGGQSVAAEVDHGGGLQTVTTPEGEAAPDLQQFARDLADAGVIFYGADWCPACTVQKELFADGKDNLPFIEVTNPDRSTNATGLAAGITQFPTWEFTNGNRLLGLQTLEELSQASGVAIPTSDQPTFEPVGDLTVRVGSPLHVPIDAYDPGDGPLTVTVSVADPNLLEASVLDGNRSIRIDMEGYGDMVFELFEQRAPTATGRVVELANSGFYDGILFHRVVDDFVIQAGDPTATGSGGSTLGDFDDDFHPDLQHNREGVLSFAKAGDDTNDSQFFITETPTRFLDFNHSVFGQLVEGFDVRQAISETAVNNSQQNRPIDDIVISTIDVFNDNENAVVMLKPTGNGTGNTTVTFTVTDGTGNTFTETINVNVADDTSNSQPFLNPIADPPSAPAGSPTTLQLSSVDVEGDAVTYFAQSVSGASSGNVSVDATTGLVTVTPASGFTGTFAVNVGVQPGPGVVGNASGDFDSQRVEFTFDTTAVATPTGLDLLSVSDTGASPTDNITRSGSMTFQVAGVTSGATVELINTATGVVVGTGTATGSTISITTNNISALGDGTYSIAARQREGGNTSGISSPISIVYDSTNPASVLSSALTTAVVGRAYGGDLISSEEGSGLVYALTTAPAGATIDGATGAITWTPTATQTGNQNFVFTMTDLAGNVRSENLTVAVTGTPQAEVSLRVTDLNGNEISSIAVGQEFLLEMIGVDARPFNKPGVYAIYADILFDSGLITPIAGSPIEFNDDFDFLTGGTVSDGLIDELGAVNTRLVASNEPESLIATVRMRALSSGSVNIRSEPADDNGNEILLFGQDDRIPAGTVAYGNVSLAIGQSFAVTPDTFTIAEDGAITTLDVLANDTISTGGTLSVVSVTQPTSGGTVTLSGGSVRFTPAADFNGDAVFTYRVADSNGIQENSSVTVTVTPVNDPPTAAADTFLVDQDSGATTLDVLANDSSAPDTGETLRVSSVGTSSAGGTVAIGGDGASVLYTPPAGFIGTDTFTYTTSDGTDTDTATATITVESADDPPTAQADVFTVSEDAAEVTFDVLSNDTRDDDNQAFVISAVGTPSQGGTARVSADGTQFFYRPGANFAGTETVTYTIRDTGGGVSTATVTFTVTPVNDAPPQLDKTVTLNRGQQSEFAIFELDELPANIDSGETLRIDSASTTTSAGGTTRIDAATGTLFYTPPSADFVGTDSVTYTISDGSLNSSGTLAITVNDFAERSIFVDLENGAGMSINNLMLRGTNLLGAAVEVSATANGERLEFGNLLPGSYTVDVPAIPFLQNASQPRQIVIESEADDGDASVALDVGRLRPEYISIRDWLGNAPRQSLLVAIEPGQSGVLTMPTPVTDTITDPVVEMDQDGTNLTIRGSRINDTSQQSEQVEATMPVAANPRVQSRGEVDGLQLLRVSVQQGDVTFTPSATTTTTTTESSTASIQAVAPVDSAASSPVITLGQTQAEGESLAAVTVADVVTPFAAVTQVPAASMRLATLPLAEGELWVQDDGVRNPSPEAVSPAANASAQNNAMSIDSAMETVAPELTLVSPTADGIADAQSMGDEGLDASAIDQALATGFDGR